MPRSTIGDPCPTCGRRRTETVAGGLIAYCWVCNDRTADPEDIPPPSDPNP